MDPHRLDGKEITFRIITAGETIALRHSVLWPDAPVSQVLLQEDNEGTHIGAFIAGGEIDEPIAVISLFPEPLPIDNALNGDDMRDRMAAAHQSFPVADYGAPAKDAEIGIRFRKFACNPGYQGQGVGSRLLEYATEKIAKEMLGGSVIWCDARVATAGWYLKRGLAPFGEILYKSGVEYIRMKRSLA